MRTTRVGSSKRFTVITWRTRAPASLAVGIFIGWMAPRPSPGPPSLIHLERTHRQRYFSLWRKSRCKTMEQGSSHCAVGYPSKTQVECPSGVKYSCLGQYSYIVLSHSGAAHAMKKLTLVDRCLSKPWREPNSADAAVKSHITLQRTRADNTYKL